MSATRPRKTEPAPAASEAAWPLAALLGLASQPLFDLLGRNPEFLVAHRLKPVQVVALGLALGLLPLVAALALRLLGRRRPGLAERVGLPLQLAAAMLLFLPWQHRWPAWPAWPTLLAALVLAQLLVLVIRRSEAARQMAMLLAAAGPLLALQFLLLSPARGLLRSAEAPAEAPAAPGLRRLPIVVLILDELPIATLMDESGAIDDQAYPNFARLAAKAHWFRNATTVASDTSFAVPAMLAGRYPDRFRLATAADYPENLLGLLAGQGYRVVADEAGSQLCAPPCERPARASRERAALGALLGDLGVLYRHVILPAEWKRDLPSIETTWRDFRGAGGEAAAGQGLTDPRTAFERWLATLEADPSGSCHLLHIFLPHVPWRFLPSGQGYGPVGMALQPLGGAARWSEDPWVVAQGWQRHLLQTRFADRLLGRLLDRLDELGLADQAAVLVVADHGVAFQPGLARRRLVEGNLGELAAVPLFLKAPGQRTAVVDDRAAETIDILPTLAELAGVPPGAVDGHSLLGPAPERPVRRIRRSNSGELGPELPLPQAELLAQRDAAIKRRAALFPGGDPFALQAFPAWRGRATEGLPQGDGWRAELEQPAQFAAIDPAGDFVPAQIRFFLRDGRQPARAGLPFAIAVGGRVAATTRSVEDESGRVVVAALVEPGHFRPGGNRIEILALSTDGEAASSLPRDDAEPATLEDGGRRLKLPGEPAREIGRLDPTTSGATLRRNPLGASLEIVVAVAEIGEVRRVLLFEGETCLLSELPSAALAASETGTRQSVTENRFLLRLPDRMGEEAEHLRLFGITENRAYEIAISVAP